MAEYERILLTGGGGFVGSHIAAALTQAYPRAARAMLLRPGEREAPKTFTPVSADLLDEAAIDRLVAQLRPDLVIHLAGQASIGQAAKTAEQTWRVNFHGAFGLAASLARHSVRTVFLFSSTAAAYGASFRDGVLREEAPLRPQDVYSRSKAAAESALPDVMGPEAKLVIARPVNHSGPGQRSRHFVLSSFAAQIAAIESGQAEPRIKVGDLSKARDFLDVRDVVNAYMRLIACAPDLPKVSTFNVSSGEARSIASLLDELRELSSASFEIEVDPQLLRPSAIDMPSVALDSTKLRNVTGWRPQYALRDMLQALLEEWREEYAGARK